MAKKAKTYYYDFAGQPLNISSGKGQTKAAIRDALDRIQKVCNVLFVPADSKHKARLKIRTYDNDMMRHLGRNDYIPLGLKLSWGIALNNQRKISRKAAEALVIHETLHFLKMSHTDRKSSIMHPALSSYDFDQKDRDWLVKRYGKAYRTMWHTFEDGYRCLMREV